MANKLFKGFRQILATDPFSPEEGFLYFIRKESNTGKTDGCLYFNGRYYGTGKEEADALRELLGELPSGFTSFIEYIQQNELVTSEALNNLNGRVDALSAVSAETRIAALEAISADSHTHANKTVLDGISAEKVAAWDAAQENAIGAASAYTDSKYDSAVTKSEVVLSALTSPSAGFQKSYELFQGGASLGKIDIPKDMVVSSGEVVTNEQQQKVLRLYIANTDPQEHVDILVSDLAHVYTEGSGITITASDVIEAKVVAQNGLSVDGDGIKLAVATSAQTGAIAAADKEKLDSIAASAQTNVIEEVKVNGTALTITDKSVNVVLPTTAVTGSNNGVEVTVGQDAGVITAVTVTAPDFANTYAAKSDFEAFTASTDAALTSADTRLDAVESGVQTLSGVSAETRIAALEAVSAGTRLSAVEGDVEALSAVSAETRIAALEAISGQSHTHTNKDILDGIDATDIAKWDAALQSISAADNSVTVGTKDASGNQTVAVKISAAANNGLTLESDGLFAGIYYDGNDSDNS